MEYMENCLTPNFNQTGQEADQRNAIRMGIINYFKERSCYCLVRPVEDERQLRNIEELPYDKIRLKFREQLENLINDTYLKLRPKMINHEAIKGTNFADLIFYYVEAINNYAIPSILSTFERVIEKEYNKALEKTISNLNEIINNEIMPSLPIEEEALNKYILNLHIQIDDAANSFKYSDSKKYEGKQFLKKKI
eukprot:TRINITY_DN8778_c0_g1_i2.p3 TRINITY_DN8778_c0_g1~~TRINITY_DN8778_c0_g1_i2.p3  ORF type:complete len:194 (+),score=48.79 TRINITY_DN8778_c0_g1_i2:273-854(+)